MSLIRSALFFFWFALLGAAVASTPVTDVLYGHYEVHADYQLSPGNVNAGWRLSVSYNLNDNFNDRTKIVRLDPAQTVIIASPATQRTITSAVSRLGPTGAPLWLFPQNNLLGTPFMGARAVMDPGIFQTFFNGNYSPSAQGSISLRLVGVTGSGPAAGGQFGLWESDGAGLFFYFGPGTSNLIPTLPPNAHSHFNWGFTKPGNYLLEIEATGKLNPQHGNVVTSARQTFRFAVPHSSRVQGTAVVRAGRTGPGWHLLLDDSTNGVAYSPQQGFLEASAAAGTAAGSAVPGATHQMPMTFSALGTTTPDIVGLPPARALAGLVPGLLDGNQCTLRLTSVEGPGRFVLMSPDGAQRWMDSGDGIQVSDALAVSRSQDVAALAVFGAPGLYRVKVELQGMAGGQPVAPVALTLAFGAALSADHTYAQWRDSFERMHGLAAGALADSKGDFDRDGISNAAEFMLFWHGCDPARGDAGLLPRGTRDGTAAVMDFYRDTYKDTLNEGTYQISPSTAPDLGTWTTRNSRVVGQALETIETGAEQGNAYGRIMLRRLRVISPTPAQRTFFRFVIKPD